MKETIKQRVAALTLGCKLNYAESSALLSALWQKGWEVVSLHDGKVDLIIIHSCAVTAQAEQKGRQKIRALHRNYPTSRIMVIGCAAQLHPDVFAAIEGVDGVLGSNDKFELSHYERVMAKKCNKPLVCITPMEHCKTIHHGFSLPATLAKQERTRAFLKIQDGCNAGCAYCVIPHLRGASRSLPANQLVEQAHRLAASGYREIVLTGVNIGDYWADGVDLCGLLRALAEVPVSRLRLSSTELEALSDELIELVAASPTIVPHLHVPLQGGSDSLLRAMRRRYTTAMYRARIERAVERIANCAIGVDIMVGYPSETEEMFHESMAFIEALPLSYLHVFSCSLRPHTLLADEVARQERKALSGDIVAERSRQMVALGHQKEAAFKQRFLGAVMPVLLEQAKTIAPHVTAWSGHTPNYLHVLVHPLEQNEHDGQSGQNGAHRADTFAGQEILVRLEQLDDDLNFIGSVLS